MKKVLIADPSELRTSVLDTALQDSWSVHILEDRNSVASTLKELCPDALILNLSSPAAEEAQPFDSIPKSLPPVTLILSDCITPEMLELAKQLKVGCIVTIPSRIDYIKDRVNEMYTAYRSSLNSIDEILRTLGISTSLSGYRCLAVSIKKLSQNPTLLLKEIYPDTAKECGLNDASCVEHTIRTAIRSAWIKRNINNWAQYFPLNETNDIDLPTNKEFISAIARHI